jgi:hypothetical protein
MADNTASEAQSSGSIGGEQVRRSERLSRAQLVNRIREARSGAGISMTTPPPGVSPASSRNPLSESESERSASPEVEDRVPDPPPGDGRPPVGGPVGGEGQVNVGLQRRVIDLLGDVEQFFQLHTNVRVTQRLMDGMDLEYARLSDDLKDCRAQLQNYPAMTPLLNRLRNAMLEMGRAVIAARASVPDPHTAPRQARARSRSPERRGARNRSLDSLGRLESDIEFQLDRMNNETLLDVRPGAPISCDQLRSLYDVVLPQVRDSISACQHSIREYTSCGNYNRDLAAGAQDRCQFATRWISDLLLRHREKKLHLDRNLKHKEITFRAFRPGQEVSIYEFFTLFENWADGYLSEEAKADQLFNKYIDPTITESYAEILLVKHDYREMKQWLVRKFGSVVPMAHGYIKAITRLPVPGVGNVAANISHLRSVHRLLTSLSVLEIEQGVPVPRLQEYLGSNAFLSALFEAIPPNVRKEFAKELVRQGLEDPYMLEGRQHLTSILNLIKATYRELEWEVMATANQKAVPEPASGSQANQSKKPNKSGAAHVVNNDGNGAPHLTGGNATPLGHQNPRGNQQRFGQQQNQQHQTRRWSCPMKGHNDHDISACAEFFAEPPDVRRVKCRFNCCYTCLSRDKGCKGGCSRYSEVPADVICVDCATNVRYGTPPCVLLCGLKHRKPSVQELKRSLESWIPGLNIDSLGNNLRVNLSWFCANSSNTAAPVSHITQTSKPTAQPSNVVYDTHSGQARKITNKDTINRTSQEIAYYAMQTIRINNKDVLLFFDSGANGHLIEGALAESLGLDVISDEVVPIGGIGEKCVWSEYGMYTITIGPDLNEECHELDVQGIRAITNEIPQVDFEGLWSEANTVLQGRTQMPLKIGGCRVSMLVGIKSTKLGPKLLHTLPSGLGIYESVLLDVYGSNICFGGPHEVFTKACKEAGKVVNNVEILFTEMAQAYMQSPRTSVAVNVAEHRPMRQLTQESEFMDSGACVNTDKLERGVLRNESVVLSHEKVDQCGVKSHVGSQVAPPKICETHNSCGPHDRNPVSCPAQKSESESFRNLETEVVGGVTASCQSCLTAKVPLHRLKGLQDELDVPKIVEYHCKSCSNCSTCKMSARAKTMSRQEEFAQQVCEDSVAVDLDAGITRADLPSGKELVVLFTAVLLLLLIVAPVVLFIAILAGLFMTFLAVLFIAIPVALFILAFIRLFCSPVRGVRAVILEYFQLFLYSGKDLLLYMEKHLGRSKHIIGLRWFCLIATEMRDLLSRLHLKPPWPESWADPPKAHLRADTAKRKIAEHRKRKTKSMEQSGIQLTRNIALAKSALEDALDPEVTDVGAHASFRRWNEPAGVCHPPGCSRAAKAAGGTAVVPPDPQTLVASEVEEPPARKRKVCQGPAHFHEDLELFIDQSEMEEFGPV